MRQLYRLQGYERLADLFDEDCGSSTASAAVPPPDPMETCSPFVLDLNARKVYIAAFA
jgi:hypothetical protein